MARRPGCFASWFGKPSAAIPEQTDIRTPANPRRERSPARPRAFVARRAPRPLAGIEQKKSCPRSPDRHKRGCFCRQGRARPSAVASTNAAGRRRWPPPGARTPQIPQSIVRTSIARKPNSIAVSANSSRSLSPAAPSPAPLPLARRPSMQSPDCSTLVDSSARFSAPPRQRPQP